MTWTMRHGETVVTANYLSIRDAATWAGVSRKTIKRWIKKGLLYHQVGNRGKVLIRPDDIEAFLTKKQAVKVDLGKLVEEVFQNLKKAA